MRLHLAAKLAVAAALTALPVVLAFGPPVSANGTSVTVVLSYLKDVSNFGPATAFGSAEILAKEGEIKVVARGLQPLVTQTYQIWLVNTSTHKAFSGGRVSADDAGNVNVTNVLPREIPDEAYNLIFLSVEPPDLVVNQPSLQRSIAGTMGPLTPTEALPDQIPLTGGAPVDVALPRSPAETIPNLPSTWTVVSQSPEPFDVTWRWALVGIAAAGAGSFGYLAGRRTPAGRSTR